MRTDLLPFTLLGACALAACSASDPDASACAGPAPAIDDCIVGATWAECGGTESAPRFACRRADGRCHWFAGGCVAAGFEASPCPADDLCCLDAPPGYPLDASWRTFDVAGDRPYQFLYGWGVEPWDRTRERAMSVTLAALDPATPSVTCDPPASVGPPCGDSGADLHVSRSLSAAGAEASALVMRIGTTRGSLGGFELWLEVTRDEDESLHARLCRVPFTDGVDFACHPSDELSCATAGTVTMPAFPATEADASSVAIAVSATLADGTTIDAQL